MEKLLPGQQNHFEAFIKAAQYLAGLTAQQDIWSETGKVLVNFFGAEVGAVEERRANGEAAGHRWAFSERYPGRRDLETETREAIAEVLESGFLSERIILTPDPLSIACFPITRENQVVAVMVVGHGMPGPLSRELLNVYLGVAGLVGTIGDRLTSERELQRHRRQLEEEITERKRAEKVQRESEENFSIIFQATPDLIAITRTGDGTILEVNEAFSRLLGYSRPEAIGKSTKELSIWADPADRARWMAALEATGQVDEFETTLRCRDGSLIACVSTARHLDFGGEKCVLSVVRDITERKRAEEELLLTQHCVDKASIAIHWIHPDGRIYHANEQMCLNLGYTRAELDAMTVYDIDPVFTPKNMENVERQVLAKGSCTFESQHLRKDGTTFPVEITANIWDVHGQQIRMVFVQDITERKRAEEELRLARDELEKRVAERTRQLQETAEELRSSEERYALAVQASNDGIWDLNLETGEVYYSPRWKSILGYEGDDISGNSMEWESRVHPDDLQRVMKAGKAYKEGRIPDFVEEYRLRHRDGSYRWVLSRRTCVHDSHGKPCRMVGAITDITERKKLEQQLFQSQKMESIGILAGGVAHDFNNLLTAISGYGQILMETIPEDDDLSQENIGNVLKAADRAAELTRGLLAFSRKQTISPKPVHIDSLIGSTGRLIQRIIGEDIEFGTNFPDRNLLVEADPGQIEQVLMNLATNARDAMPDGGHLCITARRAVVDEGSEKLYDLPAPGKYALISVSDTGIGIKKESLGKIFEPFYTTKEVGTGTGLGLSIVHGIIKQHNGSVLVRSEPGRGTQVDIYLPMIEGHAEVEKSKPAALHAAGMETLLVVEDEEIVKGFMKKILERAGYRVIVASDGEDAVERFRENDDISLVLSDVIMPRKNGRQMLEEIRIMKPGTKAVFMSGYAADYMQDKGMLDDVTEFVTKPIKKDDLLRKVREVLDKD